MARPERLVIIKATSQGASTLSHVIQPVTLTCMWIYGGLSLLAYSGPLYTDRYHQAAQ